MSCQPGPDSTDSTCTPNTRPVPIPERSRCCAGDPASGRSLLEDSQWEFTLGCSQLGAYASPLCFTPALRLPPTNPPPHPDPAEAGKGQSLG